MEEQLNSVQSERKPKKKKIITAIIFFVIIASIIYLGATEGVRWWQERQQYVKMGFASDKFPFRMFTERELVEKGLWTGESPALNAVPTRTRPEQTYTKFHQALIDGDMDAAAKCFVAEQQEEWKKSLYEIKEKGLLQGVLSDLPEKLEDMYIYNDDVTGEDTKNRDLNNSAITSYIYVLKTDNKPRKDALSISFRKNWDGDWLIEDL
jgi:hypothetical protein